MPGGRHNRPAMRHLASSLALVLALLVPCHAQETAAVATRDWSKAPAIVEVDTDQTVFACGDVHGDDERLLALLAGAKIIEKVAAPEALEWAAGKSVLVFTGDYMDKGPHGLAVFAIVRRLEELAPKKGGRVIPLAGNHEIEFLADPHRNKSEGFCDELAARKIDPEDVARGKTELGAWLRARPFGARVNDWFFAHAGNTKGRTVAELEKVLREAVDHEGFKTKELLGDDSLLRARPKPPWWEHAGEEPEASLDKLLSPLGCKHLVFGHTPGKIRFRDGTERKKGTLASKYGRVFMIDVGMSRGVGDSEGALLRIERVDGKLEAFSVTGDGRRSSVWREP
jgi:hypothetical protein